MLKSGLNCTWSNVCSVMCNLERIGALGFALLSPMAALPDEIWSCILEMGVQRNVLNYRDLSSISIASRRLRRLSNQGCLWKLLLTQDFPSESQQATLEKNFRAIYRTKFERVKSVKAAAHKRLILRAQSQALVLEREIKDLQALTQEEKKKMNDTLVELKNLERVRQTSVALQLWQPQVVRMRQQNVLEQSPIDMNSRIQSLKMEMNVCKERIVRFSRSFREKQNIMERVKEDLEALRYNPVQDFQAGSSCRPCSQTPPKKARTTEARAKKCLI